MRRLVAMVAASIVLFVGTPLNAQWTGTRLGPKPASAPDGNISKEDVVRITMRSFARCVMGVRQPQVMKYLDTIPGSPEANRMANTLAIDGCLVSDELRFNEKLFRWTVYDELYSSKFRNFDVAKIAGIPETDFTALAAKIGADGMGVVAVWQLGECSVRAAPKEAEALVRSTVGSKAESAAINAIVPFVGSCVDQNSQLKFSKPVLRGLMAEALYKLAIKSDMLVSAKGGN